MIERTAVLFRGDPEQGGLPLVAPRHRHRVQLVMSGAALQNVDRWRWSALPGGVTHVGLLGVDDELEFWWQLTSPTSPGDHLEVPSRTTLMVLTMGEAVDT